MNKQNLTAHMMVKNEEQWVWYAIQSIIDSVDKIIIFDTGSIDKTVEIIKTIQNSKITLTEMRNVTPEALVQLRNKQIKKTKTDWFLLIDGDEVWPDASIKALLQTITQAKKEIIGVVVKALLPIGDLYHHQEEKAGRYKLLGRRGHYNIRAYRRVSGYQWQGVYPLEAYCDENGHSINAKDDQLIFLEGFAYWHLRHLHRSSVKGRTIKLEIGKKTSLSLPEVFFKDRLAVVPSPWVNFSKTEYLAASILTPFRKMKRFIRK